MRIGFIGLGNMGGPMALNLIKAGHTLVVYDVRRESAKPLLQALVQEITGVKVVSLHHDISTATGEAFIIFTLAESPFYRQPK